MNKTLRLRKPGARAGYSLLEVLIALVILTIGIMGFLTAFTRTIMQTNASRNDTQCMLIANAIVEELKSRPFDQWGNLDSLAALYATNFYGDRTALSDSYYSIQIAFVDKVEALGASVQDARDVTVTINYNGWQNEQRTAGFENRGSAFVLETTIVKQISDDIYGDFN